MDYILFHLKQVTAENPADFHRIQKPEDAENKWKKYVDSVKWSDHRSSFEWTKDEVDFSDVKI